VGFGLGLDLEGREQFLNFMQARKRAFPDITLQHTNIVEQGDQVVVEFVATGTHLGPLMTPNGEIEATGKPVTLHVVQIHAWKDDKLVNLVQYQDPTSPLRQVGFLQQQPACVAAATTNWRQMRLGAFASRSTDAGPG